MVDLLLQLMYFVRPLMFIYVNVNVFGLGLFEILTIAVVVLLFVCFLLSPPSQNRSLDRLDLVMLAFVAWCGVVTVIQWEDSDLKASIKWVLPFLMYIFLRRLVSREANYLRYLKVMIFGFFLLTVANSIAIWRGVGLFGVGYYNGIERYQGIFKDLHSMGHVVGFTVMLVTIYLGLLRAVRGSLAWRREKLVVGLCAVMIPLALYCLVKGSVRTVMVGLVVFFGVLLLLTNRRRFVAYVVTLSVVALMSSYIQAVFWDLSGGVGIGTATEMAGSGRPLIWEHNLGLYAGLPIEDQVLGLGVGNESGIMPTSGILTREYLTRAWESHNDFLSALMELGFVGLAFVLYIYYLLFQKIRHMPGEFQPLFLAMLAAVIVMNVLSNSYLNRFGMGQLFVMAMVGVDVFGRRLGSLDLRARPVDVAHALGRPRAPFG